MTPSSSDVCAGFVAELFAQLLAFEQAEHRLRIADVEGEEQAAA